MGQLAGRNTRMENIATIVFSKHFYEEPNAPVSDGISGIDQDTSESDQSYLRNPPMTSYNTTLVPLFLSNRQWNICENIIILRKKQTLPSRDGIRNESGSKWIWPYFLLSSVSD